MAVGKLTLPFSSHHMLSSEYIDRAGFFWGGWRVSGTEVDMG